MFKAKHRQTGKKVALKKVLMENEKEGVRGHSESTVIVKLDRPVLNVHTFGTPVLHYEQLSMWTQREGFSLERHIKG